MTWSPATVVVEAGEEAVDGKAERIGEEHQRGLGSPSRSGQPVIVAPSGVRSRPSATGRELRVGQRRREHRQRGAVLDLAGAADDRHRGGAEHDARVEQVAEREREVVHGADEVRRREAARAGRARRHRRPRGSRPRPRRPRATRPGARRGHGEPGAGIPGHCTVAADLAHDRGWTATSGSRQSWTRSRTSPTTVRAMRRAIGVRDGRRSSTVTGTSATTRPARSARSTSSVSKRSVPLRQRAHDRLDRRPGASPSCRGCRTPGDRSPTRSTVAKPAVIARRGHGRVSWVPGHASSRRRSAGPSAAVSRGSTTSTKRGVEVVDVEHDDDVAARRPGSRRAWPRRSRRPGG